MHDVGKCYICLAHSFMIVRGEECKKGAHEGSRGFAALGISYAYFSFFTLNDTLYLWLSGFVAP